MNRLVAIAFGLVGVVVLAVVGHFYLPKPISEARGEWQIKDWYSHPDATREQLEHYRDVRGQYPRTIDIGLFGQGSMDSAENCSWTQSLSSLLEGRDLPRVWVTTLTCENRDPIGLVVRPFASALTPYAVFSYYFDANDREITVRFRKGDSVALIEYVPADWPRPSNPDSLGRQEQGR